MSAHDDPAPGGSSDPPRPGVGREPGVTAVTRMAVALTVGVVVGVAVSVSWTWPTGILLGWK